MICIEIDTIPAAGTTAPRDTAATAIDGHAFHAKSRSSAIAKLARSILEAGIPNQPWEAWRNGKCSMRGRSLSGVVKLTISEPDGGKMRWKPWKPFLPDTGQAEMPCQPATAMAEESHNKRS